MKNSINILIATCLTLLLFNIPIANSDSENSIIVSEKGDFKILALRYRHDQRPKKLPGRTIEILNSSEGRAVAAAAATAFGVARESADVAIYLLTFATIKQTKGGETRRYHMPIPEGYQYCRTLRVAGGENSQTKKAKFALFLNADSTVLHWNSWAKQEGLSKGGNWANHDFDVVFVRSSKAQNYQCKPPGMYQNRHPMIFLLEKDGKERQDHTG